MNRFRLAGVAALDRVDLLDPLLDRVGDAQQRPGPVLRGAAPAPALEGGVGGVCCSSGHAAQIMALFPIMGPGLNVVVSTRLYGGSVTQFSQTIKRFGWSATFVDFDDLDAVKAAIDDNTLPARSASASFC